MAGKKLPLPLKIIPRLTPAWIGHLQGLEITDGDNTFLIAQVACVTVIAQRPSHLVPGCEPPQELIYTA